MNQVEVYVFLHSIAHGITTVSAQDTLGNRRMLPTHEIEFIPDPERPRRGLIRMSSQLASIYGLMPAAKKIDVRERTGLLGETRPMNPGGIGVDDLINKLPDELKSALALERQRGEEVRTPRFRPARDGQVGNEAGFLAGHRARNQVEQLASELPAEATYPGAGE